MRTSGEHRFGYKGKPPARVDRHIRSRSHSNSQTPVCIYRPY